MKGRSAALSGLYTMGAQRLTLTERKAIAPPIIDEITAITKPSLTPYVNPINVIEPENPINGGCDESTAVNAELVQGIVSRRPRTDQEPQKEHTPHPHPAELLGEGIEPSADARGSDEDDEEQGDEVSGGDDPYISLYALKFTVPYCSLASAQFTRSHRNVPWMSGSTGDTDVQSPWASSEL